MKHILRFSFSIICILCNISIHAQENDTIVVTPKIERYGIRVGADLSKIVQTFGKVAEFLPICKTTTSQFCFHARWQEIP